MRAMFRAFGRAVPGYAFCLLVAVVLNVVSRQLAPGSELPLTVSMTVVLLSISSIGGLGALLPNLLALESSRITDDEVWIGAARLKLPWTRIAGWRVVKQTDNAPQHLRIKSSRGALLQVDLPDDPAAQAIIDRFRAHAPEDESLSLPVLPAAMLRADVSVAMYASILLMAGCLAFLDARALFYVSHSEWRSHMGLVPIGLLCVNALLGPGLVLGWTLRRHGQLWRTVLAYAIAANVLTALVAMLFTFPFVLQHWRPF
jgi:hypothetical protein